MHKAVNSVKYQNKTLVNAQNSAGYMQVSIDASPFWDLLISVPNQPFTLQLNVDIMGFPRTDGTYSELDAQSDAFQIGVEFLHYFRQENIFMDKIAIHDYQFIGFTHYTDDNCAGVRMSVNFTLVNPINLCTFMDNFSDEFIPEEPEDIPQIDLVDPNPPSEINDLVLKPILLPTKK